MKCMGTSSGYFHSSPKKSFHQIYNEAVDTLIQCISDRFYQPGYSVYSNLESIVLKGAQRVEYETELESMKEL